jgi:YHS domain-containing protein
MITSILIAVVLSGDPGLTGDARGVTLGATSDSPIIPGAAPLGLDGYCPVSVVMKNHWQIGDPRFSSVYEGRTYYFSGADERREFSAAPGRYSPVLSGLDPVRFVETGERVEGKRNFGVYYDTIYLFVDEKSRAAFEADPQRYFEAIQRRSRQR